LTVRLNDAFMEAEVSKPSSGFESDESRETKNNGVRDKLLVTLYLLYTFKSGFLIRSSE